MLGTLSVSEDGRPVPVRGTLQRRLLGLLLSRRDQVVSAEALIEALWNGAPPPSAHKTLQSHLVRLRDAVDPQRVWLQTEPPGYVLRIGPEHLDAARFEQLVGRARRAASADALEGAAAMLAEALGLWRGPAYADLRDCDALAAEASRLDELRLAALEERLDAELPLAWGAELVPELEQLVAEHPFRERLWGHLAVALYRAGRQADALAALNRVRTVLRDELGVDPGPELRAVERAILTHDSSLRAGRPRRRSPLPAALAADDWPVVGRRADIDTLLAAWAAATRSCGGAVAVRGPAGIGKSRLLAEFARTVATPGVRILAATGRPDLDPLTDALRRAGISVPDGTDPVAALGDAAEQAPTCVLLDDLQLAGAWPSLRPAVGAARQLPLLIVIGYDDDGLAPALAAAIDGLELTADRVIRLGPLSSDAVAEVVRLTVGEADRPAALRAATATDGHPRRLRLALARTVEEAAAGRLAEAAREAHDARRELGPARHAVTSGVLDLRAARTGRAAAEEATPADAVACPFKGLAGYQLEDAPFFVGREQLTAQLVARLVEDDLVAVVGPSGSGKSSVARAGLLAALADGVLPGPRAGRRSASSPVPTRRMRWTARWDRCRPAAARPWC